MLKSAKSTTSGNAALCVVGQDAVAKPPATEHTKLPLASLALRVAGPPTMQEGGTFDPVQGGGTQLVVCAVEQTGGMQLVPDVAVQSGRSPL